MSTVPPFPRLTLAVLLLVALAAFALRIAVVPHRPMHTDEAVNALVLAGMLEGNPFRYDPQDKHGPSLSYATYPLVRVLGVTRLDQLAEWQVRLVPATFGAALLFLPALFARELGGPLAALGSALWLGLGAPFVYYGAYWIHETLFVFFTVLMFAAAVRWLRTGRDRWAFLAGAAAGLLVATKETAVLTFAATAAGLAAVALVCRPSMPARLGRAASLAAGTAAVVVLLAFTSLGRHPYDLINLAAAATRFTARAAGEGHEKPWFTYVAWLGTPNLRSLPWLGWTLLVACAGAFFLRGTGVPPVGSSPSCGTGVPPVGSIPSRGTGVPPVGSISVVSNTRPLPVFLAAFAAAALLLYSLIPYKTPWLALNVLAPVALLGGAGLAALAARSRLAATAFTTLSAALLLSETHRLCVRFPTDGANPWAYVPTVPDTPRLQARIEAYAATRPGTFATLPVQVIGPDIWPLPWYLRHLPQTRYAIELPAQLDAPVIIADLAASDAVAARLGPAYDVHLHGLRPDVLVTVFLRRDP